MRKSIEILLVLVLGLLVGLVLHGLIEILAIWILTTCLSSFFLRVSWESWLLTHLIYSIVMEVLGIVLVFWLHKKKIIDYGMSKRRKS